MERILNFIFGIILIVIYLTGCSRDINPPDTESSETVEPDKPDSEEVIIPEHDFILGSLFGFEGDLRKGRIHKNLGGPTTYYNAPLFKTVPEGTESGWWDNLAEEIAYSGLDFITANCRGLQPSFPDKYVDHGDPTYLKNLVEAMERRGVDDKFKIAIFDDCPASWEAARNHDLGVGYAGYSESNPERRKPYPLKNIEVGTQEFQDSVYQYIWDYNIKLAFQNIPEKYLLKYNDRPVVFFWGCGFVGDVPGKLLYILNKIREDCIREFNMDPLLIIDQDWPKRDYTLTPGTPAIGGVNDWFNMSIPYTVRTFNNLTVGIGVPGFLVNDLSGHKMFLDADHGKLLWKSLDYFARRNAEIVMIEGFTDVLENAALWRSTDSVYYDFPNQRLNILRKWSSDPYPKEIRVQAEACDYFKDNSLGNSGGQFRDGSIDIKECNDIYEGWCVTATEKDEWLKWVELPFSKGQSTIMLRYASQSPVKIYFEIGGIKHNEIELPATGGEWKEINAASITFEKKGWYETILNIVSGNADLNYFTIISNE
jgi:hypothetical protein